MEGTWIESQVGEVCECEGLDQRSWKIHNHLRANVWVGALEEEGNRPTVLMFDSKFFFFFPQVRFGKVRSVANEGLPYQAQLPLFLFFLFLAR